MKRKVKRSDRKGVPCIGCGTPFIAKHRNAQFHSRQCYQSYWSRNRQVLRKDPRFVDERCVYCQARGDEVDFRVRNKCATCYRQIARMGICEKCQQPLRENKVCRSCDPPPGTIQIILLDRRFERERVIYRKPLRGTVLVGHRRVVITAVPLVVSLPGPDWVKVRV